ncbi:MAG: hypothetical protein FJ301_04170 [Planctomycetes bacterium]|nr:hypothetical protein [Planctomycetota bacterium]
MLLAVVKRARKPKTVPAAAETEFYAETKWCGDCRANVRFLMSVNHSYCIHCGGTVKLFDSDGAGRFGERVRLHKWQAS